MFRPLSLGSVLLIGVLSLTLHRTRAADPPRENPVLVDATGKELTLAKWKIVAGVHKLGWLDGKPDAFAMREFGSTTFKDGVTTLIPIKRVRSVRYDYDKETAYVDVSGLEKPLEGTTKFKDINMLTLEAEVNQGASGVADLRYKGGVVKGGFKSVKFPEGKPFEKPPIQGEVYSFLVLPEGKGKTGNVQTAHNVKPLYRFADGGEKLLPFLIFKKTLKVNFAEIQSIQVGEHNFKEKTAECEVATKEGPPLSLTLLGSVEIEGKKATFEGFLGEVPAGFKLFPIHTFEQFRPGEIKIDLEKKEPKKEKTKKEPIKGGDF